MVNALQIAFGFILAALFLVQIYSYRKLRRQTLLMQLQGREIERQMRELQQHRHELVLQQEEKLKISSVVSHDLKGPFNRIFALGQLLLLTGDNFTHEQKEYLAKIHQIVADGLNMLRNLLDYRRLEDKGIQLVIESVNIIEVMNALIKNYGLIASKKNIRIHFDHKDTLTLVTDKTCLSRITDNLLSNAIKFSPPEREIYVVARDEEGAVKISIKDEGPGLSADDQKKLFKKYQHLTPRPTGGETSTGLGLYLAQEMAIRIHGKIRCESEGGVGSIFTMSLRAMEK